MKNLLTIKRSLISVSDKSNITKLSRILVGKNIEIISTGNTYKILSKKSIEAKKIEKITNFKEILNGRVKTLHPSIFGGILADFNNEKHIKEINALKIQGIQLVIVNLYPFVETIKSTKSITKCIENIDIGGPSLIRAAAKNFASTCVVVDIKDYELIIDELNKYNGISLKLRKMLALKAFKKTMNYDLEIFKWFESNIVEKNEKDFFLFGNKINNLRYGENPHQSASIYSYNLSNNKSFYKQLNGKSLSFNNLNDIKATLSLLSEFNDPAAVIVKHAIPCGVAEGKNALFVWKKSLSADKLSAFGGVVAFNRTVDKNLAKELNKIFLEVVAAISFTSEALKILKEKPNLRVIEIKRLKDFKVKKPKTVVTMPDIFLVQESDMYSIKKKDLKVVSKIKPTKKQIEDLVFANKVVKHVRSNAIVIAKNKVTLGIGSGNTSRVDSVNFALLKANRSNEKGNTISLKGAVMASDAFFPFPDSILIASKSGVKSIIQPGGSIKDKAVIKEVDEKKLSMVFTNKRSFTH